MKNLISKILPAVALVVLAFQAAAATPNYTSKTDPGTAASPAEVVFLSDPSLQIRIVSVNWLSDTNRAVLSFTTGEGAYQQTITNSSTTDVTNVVNTTAGHVAGSILLLERGGTAYTATLSSTNNGTNIVLNSGGWGVIAQPGDSIYQMSSATSLPVGATTNWAAGEAIFVGGYGRPVRVVLTPALATNALNSVVGRYE